MVLLFDDSSSRELMRGTDLQSDAERIEDAKGHIRKDSWFHIRWSFWMLNFGLGPQFLLNHVNSSSKYSFKVQSFEPRFFT